MPINYYCDVEVQSNILTTDTSNSRVGVNIASPATTFHANGVVRAGGSNGQTYTEIGPDSIFFYNTGVYRGSIDLYPNSSSGNLYIGGANGSTIYFGAPTSWTTNISVQGNITGQGNCGISSRYSTSSQGTSSAPVYYFSGRSTTGMYFNYSPEEIRWSISGTQRLSVSASKLRMVGDIAVSGNNKVYSESDEIYLMAGGTSGTNIKVDDSTNEITNNTDTIVNGYVKATATSDAYKGYIKNTINTIVHEKAASADYNYIPFNSVQTGNTNQYYNAFVAPYNGRVKKIHVRHSGGSTPTATNVRFKKQVNGTLSSTVYSATVSNGATTNMQAEYNFGNSDFTFNEGDLLRIAMQTSDAFGTQSKTMGGGAVAIVLEYNIT
tara:strand:+ start:181 stop:1320 length:1140 start_codon:yes stop_codon:yes gene_type:complete